MSEKKIKIISDIAKPYNKRFPGPFKPWIRQWDQKMNQLYFDQKFESHTVELFLINSSQVKRIDPKTLFELSWCLYSAFLTPQQRQQQQQQQQQQHKQQCWQQQQQQKLQLQLQLQSSSWTFFIFDDFLLAKSKKSSQLCSSAENKINLRWILELVSNTKQTRIVTTWMFVTSLFRLFIIYWEASLNF